MAKQLDVELLNLGRLGSFVSEEKNSEIKPTVLCLKIDHTFHPACSGGIG